MSVKPATLLVVEDCHLYSSVPVSPLAALLLVKAAGSNGAVPLWAAAITPAPVGFTHCTVTSSTLLSTAPVQSAEQLTRAKRLYHVVTVIEPASYVAALLDDMSVKPALLLVVEDCHLYSSVPVSPLAALLLVKAAGSNGAVPLWAAAITPATVGFTHCTVTSSTLLSTAPIQSAEQLTRAKRLYHVVTVIEPASYVAALLDDMSVKPALLLVVEDCHLYSSVPVSPLAALLLVKAAGSNGDVPLWAAAITPAPVGFTQATDDVVTLTVADPHPEPTLFNARNCMG
jgi:hypothetical protein